jgi:hypothetical protein
VNDRLSQIEALAQRGMSDSQIMLSMGLDVLTREDVEAIEKGRASGMAMINNKLFDMALAGNVKAIAELNRKFDEMKPEPKPQSFIEKQLSIIQKSKD